MSQPVNLCQGQFAIQSGRGGRVSAWKPLIAVASLWFVIQVALDVGFGYYHQQKADELSDQAMSTYRNYFPNDRAANPRNVRRIVQGLVRVQSSGSSDMDFISLMKYTGAEYAGLSDPSSVTFNSVNYSQSRGELVVDVRATDFSRLSALRNGLSSKGLEAEIGSVVNESSGARGRLTVSGG